MTTLPTDIPSTFMILKRIWQRVDAPEEYNGKDAMIGCGPYIFERYESKAGIACFKSNPNYFAGKPVADIVEWHYCKNLDSLLRFMESTQIDAKIDYYIPLPGYNKNLVTGFKNIIIESVLGLGIQLHLAFGFKQYPSYMTEFRQAVSYAIDYQAIIDKVLDGVGEVPSRGYCSPALMGFDQNLGRLEHNPKKAEEILSRTGFVDSDRDGLRESEDGKKMKIPLTPYPEVYVNQAAHLMASQLRLLGLDAYVETLDRDSSNQKLWLDRDYCLAIGYSTPFGCMGAETAAIYYADMPGMYGTCSDSELTRMVEMAICSKDLGVDG